MIIIKCFTINFCLKVNNNLLLYDSCKGFLMKCSKLYKILTRDGWYAVSQKGSHVKMKHETKKGIIIFPNHGSQEMGKGLEKKILKDAGIKL